MKLDTCLRPSLFGAALPTTALTLARSTSKKCLPALLALLSAAGSARADTLYVSCIDNTILSYETTATTPTPKPFASGLDGMMNFLACDSAGNLFTTCFRAGSYAVEKFTPDGVGAIFATEGPDAPDGLAFDPLGNLFVANPSSGDILKFTPAGVGSVFVNLQGAPANMAFDSQGSLYVSYSLYPDAMIGKFSPDGSILQAFRVQDGSFGLALDSADNIFVASFANNSMQKFNAGSTTPIDFIDGLNNPIGMAFDSAGNLFVANSGNNTIERITPTGGRSVFATTLAAPISLAIHINRAAPACNAGGPYLAECNGASTLVLLDGTASTDPNGSPLTFLWATDCPGATCDDPTSPTPTLTLDSAKVPETCTVTLTIANTYGLTSTCKSTVTIRDTHPPTIGPVVTTPAILWPPNHQMVDVVVNYTLADGCESASNIASGLTVTSNEPENGLGDGDRSPDWAIVDAHHIRLRAERSGPGSGRIYNIIVTSMDTSGNVATASTQVLVPHAQPGKK